MQIFLNYRTADDPSGVALLDQELSREFGSETVFLASKSIPAGARWEETMIEAVRTSNAVIAVIGPQWNKPDEHGARPLDNPRDFVRRELRTAFEHGVPVIPVRINAPKSWAEGIPADLVALKQIQHVYVQFRSTRRDLPNLVHKLRERLPGLPKPEATRHTGNRRGEVHAHTITSLYQGDFTVAGDFNVNN